MSEAVTAQSMPIVVHAQYIKDLSFESPGAPLSLRDLRNPEMNVEFNLQVKHLGDAQQPGLFEVVMQARVRAMRDGQPLYLIDLDYGLAVSVDQVPEANRHSILLIDVPRLGFPFVRQILTDVTQQGGLAPLMLTPIDFTAFYVERFAKSNPAAA